MDQNKTKTEQMSCAGCVPVGGVGADVEVTGEEGDEKSFGWERWASGPAARGPPSVRGHGPRRA